MGTDSQIMDWMMDEYNQVSGASTWTCNMKSVFTGKSLVCGGSECREEATGRGVALCIREWSRLNNFDLKGKTYILQGFGNVGCHTAAILSTFGMVCVGVGDHTGYLTSSEGFNVFKLKAHVEKHRSLEGYNKDLESYIKRCESRIEFFSTECDVVIPAALQLQILEAEARALNCRLVVEAANGPVSEPAERICEQKGIDIIPDVLANSGGVVVSYYEWLQNKQDWFWPEDYVRTKLTERMIDTYGKIHTLASSSGGKKKCSMRHACYLYALKKLDAVYKRRGMK